MERPSEEENKMIVELSDAILKSMASFCHTGASSAVYLSALADALIYICQGIQITHMEFKDICQSLVNQYDEIFLVEES